MTHYVLSVCYPADAAVPSPDRLQAIARDIRRVNEEMQAAGAWVFGGALAAPGTATVVRVNNGQTLVTDGPFIETKEQVGGFGVIRAADRDTALMWAEKLARACAVPIEVRPMQAPGPSHVTAS